jgi:hypothetical protein
METITWLYILGGLGLLVAVAIFWRRLLRAALILAGLGVALAFAYAFAMQAAATRQTATAATVAATGSTAGNVATAALALALLAVVVIAGGYILWLRWQMRGGAPPRLGGQRGAQLDAGGMGDALNALVQIELLRALRDLRDPGPAALPYTWEDDNGGGDYDNAGGGDAGPLWW